MDVPGFALITGAASGIGKACAKAFAVEGSAGIALLDINQDALLAAKTEIEALAQKEERKADTPCQVLTYTVDVTDEEQVNRVVNEAAAALGRLDYVVNAAGVLATHINGAAFANTEDWSRIMNINVNGTFFVLRAAAQIMLKQEPILSSIDGRSLQRGSIINLGSILGHVGTPMTTAYTTSKHAVVGLTQTASLDYAKEGLRINAICPGYTETPMTTTPALQKAIQDTVQNAVPMRRFGHTKEIADGVLFLAGGRSSFITGSSLMVDGGYTAR
jgi:NAD(P)-dependent dehydrogenase (short-subunit alcohol dehydrogenase family)